MAYNEELATRVRRALSRHKGPRGYNTAPLLRKWVSRAVAFVSTLPPKI
jgi:hypothetical protein